MNYGNEARLPAKKEKKDPQTRIQRAYEKRRRPQSPQTPKVNRKKTINHIVYVLFF